MITFQGKRCSLYSEGAAPLEPESQDLIYEAFAAEGVLSASLWSQPAPRTWSCLDSCPNLDRVKGKQKVFKSQHPTAHGER